MVAKSGNFATDRNTSFVNDSEGNVARNVVAELKDGAEIGVTFAGIDKLFKPTVFNVTDTEIGLPPSPDTLTQSFILVNHSPTDSIFIGQTGVTAGVVVGVSTSGYEIPAGESFNIDFKTGSTIMLYAIADTGNTVKVQILEVG